MTIQSLTHKSERALGQAWDDFDGSAKTMKSSQWFLILFSAVSLVSAFVVMQNGPIPVVFILIALIASTCAQSLHEIHKRIDQIERKDDKDSE